MKPFCCSMMEQNVLSEDNIVCYSAAVDEYGIPVHDGGNSYVEMRFCPWCGKKLPESKREMWFDTLEAMGYTDPFSDDIPEEFRTDAWYNRETAL